LVAFTSILTATQGQDYYGSTTQLTFPPGTTRQQISLTILNDTLPESDETFGVRLVRPVNAVIRDAEAIVSIRDDDNAGVSISIANVTVNENVGRANVAVRLSRTSTQPVSVLVFTQILSAVPGQDYYGKTERLTFAPGQSVRNFDLTILDDGATESTETVRIRLANANNASIGNDRAVLSIIDND